MLTDHDPARLESALENLKRLAGVGIAAHEDVEGGKAFFRPSVDGDVAFRQYRHAGNAAAVFELVQVNMQQGRTRLIHRIDQSRFDTFAIIQPLGFPKVDDDVTAS